MNQLGVVLEVHFCEQTRAEGADGFHAERQVGSDFRDGFPVASKRIT
jgi:hypothetical protein